MKRYFVYLLASQKNGTLYVGMTNDLRRRAEEHMEKRGSKFAGKYDVRKLVYFEEYNDVNKAIEREKQLKKWQRKWKLDLIEKQNPAWQDYSHDLYHF